MGNTGQAFLNNLAETSIPASSANPLNLSDRYARAMAAFSAPVAGQINPATGLPDLVDEPWNAEPPGSQNFNFPFVMNTPASGSAETPILTGAGGTSGFTIPIGWGGGVIKYVACSTNSGGFQDGQGTLIWRIRKNHNQYVKNYDNIQVRLGIPPWSGDTCIVGIPGDFFEWTIQNVNLVVGTSQVMGFFQGYYWPVQPS